MGTTKEYYLSQCYVLWERSLTVELSSFLIQGRVLNENGIIEILSNVPFQIFRMNMSIQRHHIRKHMVLRQLCGNLTASINSSRLPSKRAGELKSTMPVNTIQGEIQDTPPSKGSNTKISDSWRDYIKIADEYAAYREKFICMLKPIK